MCMIFRNSGGTSHGPDMCGPPRFAGRRLFACRAKLRSSMGECWISPPHRENSRCCRPNRASESRGTTCDPTSLTMCFPGTKRAPSSLLRGTRSKSNFPWPSARFLRPYGLRTAGGTVLGSSASLRELTDGRSHEAGTPAQDASRRLHRLAGARYWTSARSLAPDARPIARHEEPAIST